MQTVGRRGRHLPGSDTFLTPSQSHPNGARQGAALASGSHPEVGGAWALRVLPGPSSGGEGGAAARAARAHFLGLVLDEEEHIARAKDILRNGLIAGARSRCVVGGGWLPLN